jgi:tRNA dimethylallyltransferase
MKLIVITGQTATGKTKLALELAEKYNGELINCDSRQIYKKLDIVTGKDTPPEAVFHKESALNNYDIGYYPFTHSTRIWLYDIVDPKLPFSSFEYKNCAIKVIKNIFQRGKTPIIVGGSYLYLQDLLYGFTIQVKPNWKLRSSLNEKSIDELQKILQELNPSLFSSLNNSDRHNPQRLIRKIEISQSSFLPEKPHSLKELLEQPNLTIELIGLKYAEKKSLQKKISERVEERIKRGAYSEVTSLLDQGYSITDPGLKTICYPQIVHYLQHNLTEEDMKKDWVTKELQYAKRQYTFMKRDNNIQWQNI